MFRSIYLGVIFNVLAMSGISLAAIKIGQVMLGLNAYETIGVAGIITLLFSVFGGFRGVVYTDFILFFILSYGLKTIALLFVVVGALALIYKYVKGSVTSHVLSLFVST